MFGKVAFTVADDSAFPNSLQPTKFTRIQLMLKNSKAYETTDGWGYALILRNGPPAQASDRLAAATCHACHSLVPNRNFVFSRPNFLGTVDLPHSKETDFKERFSKVDVKRLSEFQKRALSSVLRTESISSLGYIMSASMDLFFGSVNESVGVVSRYATEDGRVYALWDEKQRHFAIARPLSQVFFE